MILFYPVPWNLLQGGTCLSVSFAMHGMSSWPHHDSLHHLLIDALDSVLHPLKRVVARQQRKQHDSAGPYIRDLCLQGHPHRSHASQFLNSPQTA